MGAELLTDVEKKCISAVYHTRYVLEAWVAGGCLNRANSKDIDIIVEFYTFTSEKDEIARLFNTDYHTVSNVFRQYPGASSDEKYDWIVKLQPRPGVDSRPIDVLVIQNNCEVDIRSFMEKNFPLSIQRIALNVHTWDLYDDSEADSPFIIARPWVKEDAECIMKYMRYYPDKKFLRWELTELNRSYPHVDPPF